MKESGFKKITLQQSANEDAKIPKILITCPIEPVVPSIAYSLEILSNGEVHYYGEQFVEKTGHHTWTINSDSVKMINDLIAEYGIIKLEANESKHKGISHSRIIISILLIDGTYREYWYHSNDVSVPLELRRLVKRIKEIIEIKKYIGNEY